MARPNWYDKIDDDDKGDDEEWEEPPEEDDTLPCPYCKELIFHEAERCPYCEKYISEEADAEEPTSQPSLLLKIGAVFCILMLLAMLMQVFS